MKMYDRQRNKKLRNKLKIQGYTTGEINTNDFIKSM